MKFSSIKDSILAARAIVRSRKRPEDGAVPQATEPVKIPPWRHHFKWDGDSYSCIFCGQKHLSSRSDGLCPDNLLPKVRQPDPERLRSAARFAVIELEYLRKTPLWHRLTNERKNQIDVAIIMVRQELGE
jgi:hypothetical protein